MLKVKIPFLLIALFFVGCNGPTPPPQCGEGKQKWDDGTCVSDEMAGFMCCINNTLQKSYSNKIDRNISVDAGYTPIKVTATMDTSKYLVKTYAMSDETADTMVEKCEKISGFQSRDSQKQAMDLPKQVMQALDKLNPINLVKSTIYIPGKWKIETWKDASGYSNTGNLLIYDNMVQGELTIKEGKDGRRVKENVNIKKIGNCYKMEGIVGKEFRNYWHADECTLHLRGDRLEGDCIDEAGETSVITFKKVH